MQDRLPKREEVSLDLTWRLEDIYDDEKKWEEELSKVTEVADKISAYEVSSLPVEKSFWRHAGSVRSFIFLPTEFMAMPI